MVLFAPNFFGRGLSGVVPLSGNLTELVIGDDYSSANGNAIEFTVAPPAGTTLGGATCFFGGAHKDPHLAPTNKWLVQGAVRAAPTAGDMIISFNLLGSHTEGLIGGDYEYSAEIRNDAGLETTAAQNRPCGCVLLRRKQT